MKFSKIKGLIGGLAPTVASALGGPLAGAAAQSVAEALGVAPEPKAIERALTKATPEQLAEIKRAELEFEAKMKELDVDVYELETLDLQNARKHFNKDWTARAIALGAIAAFVGYSFLVTIQPPDQNSDAVINLVLGYLGGMVSSIVSFYFGSSQKQD